VVGSWELVGFAAAYVSYVPVGGCRDGGAREVGRHVRGEPDVPVYVAELEGLRMRIIQSGSRADMAALERQLVERLPGPQNLEPWAGSVTESVFPS
jgi:hypothetical protein